MLSFNSRPHKEVDGIVSIAARSNKLSIHDLTRRSTISQCYFVTIKVLSIHDLTRRSTWIR